RKFNAGLGITVLSEAPLQCSANIIESDEVRRSFRAGRQSRPLGLSLLQPSPVVTCMAHRQVGGLVGVNGYVEGVGAGGIEEPVAHHRPKGLGGQHRLGDEAVDRAKDSRSIQGRARYDFQRGIERKMSYEDRELAKHYA